MTIRSKLFVMVLLLCVILIGAITFLVVVEMKSTAIENFKSTAEGQLLCIDDIFAQYADTGKQSAEYLRSSPTLWGMLSIPLWTRRK